MKLTCKETSDLPTVLYLGDTGDGGVDVLAGFSCYPQLVCIMHFRPDGTYYRPSLPVGRGFQLDENMKIKESPSAY